MFMWWINFIIKNLTNSEMLWILFDGRTLNKKLTPIFAKHDMEFRCELVDTALRLKWLHVVTSSYLCKISGFHVTSHNVLQINTEVRNWHRLLPSCITLKNAYRDRPSKNKRGEEDEDEDDEEDAEVFKVPASFTFMPREGASVPIIHTWLKLRNSLCLYINWSLTWYHVEWLTRLSLVLAACSTSWPRWWHATWREGTPPTSTRWEWSWCIFHGQTANGRFQSYPESFAGLAWISPTKSWTDVELNQHAAAHCAAIFGWRTSSRTYKIHPRYGAWFSKSAQGCALLQNSIDWGQAQIDIFSFKVHRSWAECYWPGGWCTDGRAPNPTKASPASSCLSPGLDPAAFQGSCINLARVKQRNLQCGCLVWTQLVMECPDKR